MDEVSEKNIEVVADPQTEESSVEAIVVEDEKAEEVVTPAQSKEANAAFAQLRREKEARDKELAEEKQRTSFLLQGLQQLGVQGNDFETVSDQIEANRTGKPIDVIRQERIQRTNQLASENQLKQSNDILSAELAKFQMKRDLESIRMIDPTVKSLDDLGEDFVKLIGTGIDAETAFLAVQAKNKAHEKPKPKDIGAIGSTSTKNKDFYTSDEVDKLTDEELDDPKIKDIVRKSMTRW